ncbi:leucine-rich repeat domain-containing protein [Laspinema sp. D1]|uniref:COR domain-containing protein n=1 Tax=Laspinema palackyanum TaxID=3231601 RepID=UPI003475D528|nr:leucine-rich repeat domain-containing protein [Laspinema sp. D2b]
MTQEELLQIIQQTAEKQVTYLNLSGKGLTKLPPEIGQLTNLTRLYLTGNQLSELPAEIGQLSNLTELHLGDNQLSELPAEIGQLSNLTKLSLYDNQLRALPPEIWELFNLIELNIRGNKLSALPWEIEQLFISINLKEKPQRFWRNARNALSLGGNHLTSPPPEILNQGIDAILAYLREQLRTQQPQWISKLIVVGEGGVGKTSLLKVLRGNPFNPQESTTHGIDIRTLELPHPSKPDVTMQLNAWDFGGQQIYHATHQFFLTNRSLFLLAWNARYGYEQGKLYYWLDTLSSLAPNSPILLIATQIDEHHPSIPLAELQGKYPKIVGQCEISNKTGQGIDNLRQCIANTAAQLPLMGELWPKTWLDAANDIRSLSDKYITPQQLETRMSAAGVSQDSIPILAQYLHELGEILYFQNNPALNEIVILQPEWVTKHISRVLTSETVKQRHGILTRTEMNHLWPDLDPFMHEHFLHLLERFDLSYPIRNEAESVPEDVCLIVECLPLDPPNYQEQWDGILTTRKCQEMSIKWHLNIIPAGIPTWFIARSHRFSTGIHWRNGALLADRTPPKHLALVQAFPQQNYLQLTVRGATPQNFFNLLRDGIELTLHRFQGLPMKCTIPCSVVGCQQGSQEFDEQRLQNRYENNRLTLECEECWQELSVVKLLFGLDINQQNVPVSIGSQDSLNLLQAQMLQLQSSFNSRHQETQAAISEWQAQLQRQFTTFFHIEQEKIESHCPSVFALRPSDTDNWQKMLFGENFELQLYCEAPGEWHPALDGGLYKIEVSAYWVKIMAPHIQRLASILKYAQPIVGAGLAMYNMENYDKLLKQDMQFMQSLASELTELQNTDALNWWQKTAGVSSRQFKPKQLKGSALRQVRPLLDEKDPHQHWGGLQKVLTPEGHYLWLCEHHARQYQR